MRVTTSTSFIPIRDDSSGPKSQSTNERDFIKSCALRSGSTSSGTDGSSSYQQRSLRLDGRSWNQVRSTRRISLVRWENGSSATVEWGSRVLCTCVGKVLPPNVDRSNVEGVVALTVDLSPSASMAYRNATPASTASGFAMGGAGGASGASGGSMDENQKLETNRILRALERVLLIGGCLDTEALVVNQQWVWQLSLHLTVLDNASSSTQGGGGGNLVDSSLMACMAALRHYRQPHVQVDQAAGGNETSMAPPILIPSHEKEPTPLPLHHTPLSLTFALIQSNESGSGSSSNGSSSTASTNHVAILLDPTHREELVAHNARLTIAMNIHKEICLLDYGGGCELQPFLLTRKCCQEAAKQIPLLCQSLEESLKQADQQALQERLAQLKQQQQQGLAGGEDTAAAAHLPPLPPSSSSLLPPPLTGFDDDNADGGGERDAMEGIAYYQEQEGAAAVAPPAEASEDTAAAASAAEKQAEEAYRQLALDYNVGHVASKVADDDDKQRKKKKDKKNTATTTAGTSRLLAAMLRSGQATSSTAATTLDVTAAKVAISSDDPPVDSKAAQPAAAATEMPKVEKKKKPPKATAADCKTIPAKTTMSDDDDDEEETTMQLESEFGAVASSESSKKTEKKNAPVAAKEDQEDDDDDDVDDLAAAIIKKKSKKKKKAKK